MKKLNYMRDGKLVKAVPPKLGFGGGGAFLVNPFVVRVESPIFVTTFNGRRWVYMLIEGVLKIGGRGEQFFNDPVEPFVGNIAVGVTSRGMPPTEAYIFDGPVVEIGWDANGLGGAAGDDLTISAACAWILPRVYPAVFTIG
jgi:hypothetical protein